VATALLVAGPTLTSGILGADSACILQPRTQALFKGCLHNVACGSFQLMHSSSQDALRIGYTGFFTRYIGS